MCSPLVGATGVLPGSFFAERVIGPSAEYDLNHNTASALGLFFIAWECDRAPSIPERVFVERAIIGGL